MATPQPVPSLQDQERKGDTHSIPREMEQTAVGAAEHPPGPAPWGQSVPAAPCPANTSRSSLLTKGLPFNGAPSPANAVTRSHHSALGLRRDGTKVRHLSNREGGVVKTRVVCGDSHFLPEPSHPAHAPVLWPLATPGSQALRFCACACSWLPSPSHNNAEAHPSAFPSRPPDDTSGFTRNLKPQLGAHLSQSPRMQGAALPAWSSSLSH